MSRIDYSKWDKMDYGDSSSSDADDDHDGDGDGDYRGGATMPRVTRLDVPTRVTRAADGTITLEESTKKARVRSAADAGKKKGGGGSSEGDARPAAAAAAASPPAASAAAAPEEEGPKKILPTSPPPPPPPPKPPSSFPPHRFTKNGGSFVDELTGSLVCWCQDRREVIISVGYDPTRFAARDLTVTLTGAVPYSEREAAVGSGGGGSGGGGSQPPGAGERWHGSLVISAKRKGGGEDFILLRGDLPHFVHRAEDDDDGDDDAADWEIETLDDDASSSSALKKFVRVTLRKAVPMPGMCVWWDRPLVGRPSIDVGAIEGRTTGEDNGKRSRREQTKEAWDEAHRMFRERVKSIQKQPIDLEEEEEEDRPGDE